MVGLQYISSSSTKLAMVAKSLVFVLTVQFVLFGYGICSELRFNSGTGKFKILQVSDTHYANGATTTCRDVLDSQAKYCSDLNTTSFLGRMIQAESPDLIVFTGDNIYSDAKDAATSMNAVFAPAIESNIPWAAVLGNHDEESNLSRENAMKHIVTLKNTLSQFNPADIDFKIDGFGNYNLEVAGAQGSEFQDNYVLNLYFVDSGDRSKVPAVPGYDWVKASQQYWFQNKSSKFREDFPSGVGLVFFHIPVPEYQEVEATYMTGVRQEWVSSPDFNSGFYTTMKNSGDVKAVFVGHDHKNDYCGKVAGEVNGLTLCYGGGFGYHAYGLAGWERRSRLVEIELEKKNDAISSWGSVAAIKTWKRLDDDSLTMVDEQTLWRKETNDNQKIKMTKDHGMCPHQDL